MKADIGFLGGGQLARMSIQAAQRMGLRCVSLDPGADTPASQIAPAILGSLDDPEAIARVLRGAERVTLENEFIPAHAIREAFELSGANPAILMPGVDTLETIQDKLSQRLALARHGVPSPHAVPAAEGMSALGCPMVLKARFGGYDGKGTRYARTQEDLETLAVYLGDPGWLAEEFVSFHRELAVMVYRTPDWVGAFPTVETVQTNHVCDLVLPCDVDASEIAIAAVEAVGGFGLFGVELFDLGDGRLQVNELAPRPHNTGHYTLDWGGLSQFDVHVRLTLGLPVPSLEGARVAMANLLGQEGAQDFRAASRAAMDSQPDARVHWYGKAEAKPGRKMGHLNLPARPDEAAFELGQRARQAREAFYKGWQR